MMMRRVALEVIATKIELYIFVDITIMIPQNEQIIMYQVLHTIFPFRNSLIALLLSIMILSLVLNSHWGEWLCSAVSHMMERPTPYSKGQ